jgi:transcriptional regulator with XRE-family HTH domain
MLVNNFLAHSILLCFNAAMGYLVTAIKHFRNDLGDSQQAFATRLGLSVRAIANYEAGRTPTIAVLERLISLAEKEHRQDLITHFTKAYRSVAGDDARPRTKEEKAFSKAIVYLVRNRHLTPNWGDITQSLVAGLASLSSDSTGTRMSGEAAICLTKEALQRLGNPAQTEMTKLAREVQAETGKSFWIAYEETVAKFPELQSRIEREHAADSDNVTAGRPRGKRKKK